MPIGQLCLKICQMPSMHSVMVIALLPNRIKKCNIPQMQRDEKRQTNQEVLNEVLLWVLQRHMFKHNRSTESGYFNVLFADGNLRHCKPVLAAWLADCPEYSDLHHLRQRVCFRCKCPKNELGDYVPPDKQWPRWDHNLHTTLRDPETG